MTQDNLDRETFFEDYGISDEDFITSGLEWSDLEAIHNDHLNNTSSLEPTASYIADRIRKVEEVHSIKMRIKNPEHLIEKIFRKKLKNPDLNITRDNYRTVITDLIGIRVLHLFKNDWENIHDFIVNTWDLYEPPTANVRQGDSEDLINSFKFKGCEIKNHPFGYRSVHYLVQSQPSKTPIITEVQVRTIFEEGWSEIDHRIRYPYDTNNSLLSQFLVMFNRLAGSADEMGTYILMLSKELELRDNERLEEIAQHEELVADLQEKIRNLNINKQQKDELVLQIQAATNIPKGPPSGGTLPNPLGSVWGAIDVGRAYSFDLGSTLSGIASRSALSNINFGSTLGSINVVAGSISPQSPTTAYIAVNNPADADVAEADTDADVSDE